MTSAKSDLDRSRYYSAAVALDASALRRADPVAQLLRPIAAVPSLRAQCALLATILSELYCNALEHGVLGLDSRWKRDAEGFERYVIEREERLARLRHGWVRIGLSCRYRAQAGIATIRAEDSGTSFYRTRLEELASSSALHGRGLALMRALGARLYTGKGGRGVRAVYGWPLSANVLIEQPSARKV